MRKALAVKTAVKQILYLSTSAQMGGAERSLLTLLTGMRKRESAWKISLFLGEDGPLSAAARSQGVRVRVMPMPHSVARLGSGNRFSLGAAGRLFQSFAGLLRYRSQLRTAILDIEPSIVHSNGLKMHFLVASIFRRTLRSPFKHVCHLHDSFEKRSLARLLMQVCGGRFECVATPSAAIAAELSRFPNCRVEVVDNGVDLDRFSPQGDCLDLDRICGMGRPVDTVVRIGLVATFARWKGHMLTMRALALLPADLKVRAYAIGGPIYRSEGSQYSFEELYTAAQMYCPNVEFGFTGMVAPVESAYRALDIVVHASTEREPFGMAIVEAMASGRAVIASRNAGVASIIREGVDGLLHDPEDVASLARQLQRMISDTSLRQRCAASGRAIVAQRFSMDAMASRFLTLYEGSMHCDWARREAACCA